MRTRTAALALLAPLAVAVSVAGPATAGIMAAGAASTPTLTSPLLSHTTMTDMSMPGMTMTGTGSTSAADQPAASAPHAAHHRAGTKALPKIKGSVGPGFTISINKASVPAGKYKFIVSDMGTMHNFHLTGTGVDQKTGVPFTGKVTWKVKLAQGTYSAVCDPHHETMHTTLEVTA